MVLVHEDCIWQTVHITNETDVEKIESMITTDKYESLVNDQLLEKYRVLI